MKQPIPFGKYYLLERVNVGGMAEVFKAKAIGVEGFERLVAVKRILPSIAEDREFITMFIDEAKISVQLTHANIAQIFDLGKVDDAYFIALEFVHGRDLRAIFNRARQRNEPLPIQLVCYVIMKVCEGLDYAHQKRDAAGDFLNLVHRDVSPQNIIVSHEGEVKVIDFGIAKAAGKAGKTQAGILKGKFGYMSPEQVQGMEIDRRSDIFGLGICLYELLTSERLFVAESDFATLEKVRNVDIMPPSTYNRRITEELEQIVLKALARDRSQRHQSAIDLHDELQSFLYSSGNFFSRKDLSSYMHRVFAEEIEKEIARDREYADMRVADNDDDMTHLHDFDELDPVSVVSDLLVQPLDEEVAAHAPAPGRRVPAPKATLLGMPSARPAGPVPAPSRPVAPRTHPGPMAARSVQPPGPRPQSIPPPGPSANASQKPGLDMVWDDEELSTQIYDKPEDLSPEIAQVMAASQAHRGAPAGPAPVSSPPAAPQLSAGVMAAPQGHPSPFAEPAARIDATDVVGNIPLPTVTGAPAPNSRRTMLWAAGVVVGLVVAVFAGVAVLSPSGPGDIHLRTVPSDATVTLNNKPVPGAASPWIITDVQPGMTHLIEVTKPGHISWSSKVELQPDQTIQLPPIELVAIESGFALDSDPTGAQVYVDGQLLAQVTPVRKIDLAPGSHKVRVSKQGYAPWETPVQITEGTVLELPAAQLRAGGPAAVAAVAPVQAVAPAAAPVADPGVARPAPPKRRTPRKRKRRVAPPPDDEPVDVAPPPPPPPPRQPMATGGGGMGTLRINTRPWSNVFVDGSLVGNTPQMGLKLSSGRHTITLINDDFGIRKTIKVSIKSGEVVTRVLNLSPQ